MKTSKKIIPLMFLLFISSFVFGQHHPVKPHPHAKAKVVKRYNHKVVSRNLIKGNVPILKRAQVQLKTGKNYTGDFSKAIRHQKYAIKMYKKGLYVKAALHARASRRYAFNTIKANKGKIDDSWNISKEEALDASSDAQTVETELPEEELSETELMNIQLEELGLE